jgi:DNA-binding phage protein
MQMGWPKWLAAPALALALGLGLGIAAVLPQATAQQEDQQQEQQDQDEQSDAKDDDAAGQAEDCEDHGARGAFFETAAETIGITTDELRSELEAGESLAQVAQDHGVSTETLTNALLKEMNDKLDAAVADGDLTQAEADEKKADAAEHIADIINQEGLPDHGPGHHGHGSGRRGSGDADDDTQAEESSFERA